VNKEDYWTASPWALVLMVGAAIVVVVLWRLGERLWQTRFTHRDHEEWIDLVRTILFQIIDAEIHRAELMTQLAKLIGKKPREFDEMAKEAFARSLALTPIAAAKAEECGLFERGTFERMGVPRYDAIPSLPPPPIERAVEQARKVVSPAMAWIGTVRVPRSSEPPPPSQEN
jgi:hypothetical protein